MALLRRFFYQKPPEGLLEITERVYVFDSCFSTDVLDDIVYRVRMRHIVTQLREQFSGSSFLVFNFREGERKSQLMDILSQFDMTVMDYPRQYEGCPVLSLEMIHHFMRSSDSWISLEGHQNIVLLHCERGGWPTLAFMLAGFLIYRKLYTAEQKTLDLLYREAPRGLLRLLTPLNPMPSQIRYLQYITRRNNSLEWPPPDQALTLDCIIVRVVPSFDTEGGCRPIIRVYGLDPQDKGEQTTRMLFNMSKKGKSIRYRRQADCDVIKIDIQCGVQGDVVLECIHVNADLEREEMMFRVMFNTAFIKSNMLMLGKEDIDVPWDAKDCYTKDFRAEVLFTDMDSSCTPNVPVPKLGEEVKGGPPMEDFARVQELFNDVDWTDGKRDAAFRFLQQISSAKSLSESGRIELNDKATKSDKEGNEGQDREEPLRCDGLKQLPPQLSVSLNAPALLPPPPEAPPPAPLETNTSAAAPPPPPPPVSGGEVPLLSSLVPAPKAPTPPPCPSGLKSNAPPPPPSSPSPEVKAPLPPPAPPAPPTPSPPPVAESPPAPLPPPHARGPPAVPPPPGANGPPAAPTPSPPPVAESPPAPLPPPRARGPPAAPPPPGAKGPPAAPPPPGAKVPGPPPPPPGAKVPGPPPPPPPGGQGPQAKATGGPSPPVPPLKDPKSTPATSVAPPLGTTKNSLKAFHWIKLTKLLQGSLWAEAQKSDRIARSPKIDLLELASLFPAAVSTVGAAGRGDRPVGASLGAKPEKVHLIDMQRAKNCEIMLTKVKMPLPDVASAILALDGSMLDVDQVGNLLKFCPTKEEMETIKGYSGDKEKLGKCEQFFLEMMKVPRVESKLRVFLFKLQFAIQIGDLRRGLNIVNSASKEVRESLKLQEIMQTILSIGNALNQGTARGSAIGFKLDSLLKLNDMRAKDNKTTLMHYLGKVLSDSPDLLEFHKDLAHLEEASKVQLKFLAEEMQAVNKSLEKVEQEITASENDGSVSEGFQKNLKSFLTTAEADVRSLTLLYSETGQNADALVQYFGEDPTRCPFEQVVSVLLNFVVLFKRAHDENIKFAEIERKKAEREAEQEKLKHSPSKKKSNTMKRDAEGGLASKMSKVAKAISG